MMSKTVNEIKKEIQNQEQNMRLLEDNCKSRLKAIGMTDDEINKLIDGVKAFCKKTRNKYSDMLETSVRMAEENK